MSRHFKCERKEVRCKIQCEQCKPAYIQMVSARSKFQVTANGKGLIVSLYDKAVHKWNTQMLDGKQVDTLTEFLNKRKEESEDHITQSQAAA